jgi:hypothetical protein
MFLIIAAIYAAIYWAAAEVNTRGEDSIVLRVMAFIGRAAWVAMLPFVWAPLKLAQLALRAAD